MCVSHEETLPSKRSSVSILHRAFAARYADTMVSAATTTSTTTTGTTTTAATVNMAMRSMSAAPALPLLAMLALNLGTALG